MSYLLDGKPVTEAELIDEAVGYRGFMANVEAAIKTLKFFGHDVRPVDAEQAAGE